MGIFDSVPFSPSGYGGLLNDLLARFQFPQPTPSQGFEPQPAPQVPVTEELSARQAQQPPMANLGSGIFANAPPGSLRSFIGSITGQTKDPTQALYQAFRQANIPESVAVAAALDPALRAAIIPAYFDTKPQLHTVGPGQKLVGVQQGRATELASGGPEKPPAGYEWADPNNPSRGLKAIPGGPEGKLPANEAGYLAMMDAAAPGIANARKYFLDPKFREGGFKDAAGKVIGQATGSFDIGRAQRDIRYGIETALRVATGAAAPESEVKRFEGMYLPSIYDSMETRKQKLDALDSFISNAKRLMLNGRAAPPPAAGEWTDVGGGVRIRVRQ